MLRLYRVFVVCLIAGFTTPAMASTGQPDGFLKNFADRAVASLTEEGLQKPEQAERFGDLLEEGFDIPQISQFVTARFWREASDEQKQAFYDAFRGYLIQRFLPLFDEYRGQEFETGQVRSDAAEDDVSWVTIAIDVGQNGQQAQTEWKLKKTGDTSYKIQDVKAEGTSMAITLRDEFQAFMRRKGGLDGLIDALRRQAEKAGVATTSN